MRSSIAWNLAFLSATVMLLPGCLLSRLSSFKEPRTAVESEADIARFQYAATHIEFPDVDSINDEETSVTSRPHTLANLKDMTYWDMPLEVAIRMGLENSDVMRDLGGLVIRTPSAKKTKYDPAVQDSDPRFGTEAALSAFDASFASSAFFEYNNRQLNNVFAGGGTNTLKQDLATFQTQLSKRAVTGTEFALRNNTDYDANSSPANLFPTAWNTNLEAELRHPLLKGSGVRFNRIAGPSNTEGVYSGVLVARANTDIKIAEFEQGVRNFVSDIENAYWDLYFAYRNLDAKIAARDSALEIWRRINALHESGRRGGEADKEAQAREQYYRFQEEVQNALSGRLFEGTRTFNGSSGGTFRANAGVQVAERRLRMLIGYPINELQMLRPSSEPVGAPVTFNWEHLLWQSINRRSELRAQKFLVKRRELELEASYNFLKPQLDVIGRYRWRGFGRDLLNQHAGKNGALNNAWGSLTAGKFQEWQLGAELSFPLGFRRAHAGVQNAELLLARDRALLREQERNIVLDLSNAVSEKDRAFALLNTTSNGRKAAQDQLDAVQAAFDANNTTINVVLESQRRVADSTIRYYQSLVEYTMAIKNVHFESGTLLDYDEVRMEEGLWHPKAYEDARERGQLRDISLDWMRKIMPNPRKVSRGEVPQNLIPNGIPSAQEELVPAAEEAIPPEPKPAGATKEPNLLPRKAPPVPTKTNQPSKIPVPYEEKTPASSGPTLNYSPVKFEKSVVETSYQSNRAIPRKIAPQDENPFFDESAEESIPEPVQASDVPGDDEFNPFAGGEE